MKTLREEKMRIIPILVGTGYFMWFYILANIFYNNNMIISVKNVTWDNILIKLAGDYLIMLLLPTLIIIIYRKKLTDLNLKYTSKKEIYILSIILIIFFFLHNDYSITGFYKFFFYFIVVSFGEEFIYRGYIYNKLKEKSVIQAIIISGILWGVNHAILSSVVDNSNILKGMIYEMGGGILSGWYFIYIQEKSGTLWIPILIHALQDYSYMFFGPLVAIVTLIYYIKLSNNLKQKEKGSFPHTEIENRRQESYDEIKN
jgi:membrane protease YdiL (CAAX protease family)